MFNSNDTGWYRKGMDMHKTQQMRQEINNKMKLQVKKMKLQVKKNTYIDTIDEETCLFLSG